MTRSAISILLLATIGWHSPPSPGPIRVDYALRVDSAGATGVAVEMRIHNAPATFRVAMMTHAEYDDQYWRYLAGLRGESARGPVSITRADSTFWRVNAPAGDVTLAYRVEFPAKTPQQSAWKAHLTPTGGLIGGPHSFLYVVEATQSPVHLSLTLPSGWDVATGLERGSTGTYRAPTPEVLIDSPILVGDLRRWSFDADGVPHEIALLRTLDGVPFDSAHLVSNIERLTRETARSFKPMPYRRYVFLLEDATDGGLEHLNSVTIGVRSTNLARDPDAYLGQIAHEFFHTWNEVHIRPAEWVGLRHETPAPTGVLWLSEGVTLYYADLLLRRAGLRTVDSTRVAHFERLLTVYLANPSHAMVSPERTSQAFNLQARTGDYTPSFFTQGELLGLVLDLMIREGSGGRRSLDDVVRALAARFDWSHGIRNADVERAVAAACGCAAHGFFTTYITGAKTLDVDRWLGVLGLQRTATWAPARAADSSAVPDLRVSGYMLPGESEPRLQIWFPETVWGRAGLHTGDRIVSWNGVALTSVPQLRSMIGQLHLADTVRVMVRRNTGPFEATITIAGYDRPAVRITPRPDAMPVQRALFSRWSSAH